MEPVFAVFKEEDVPDEVHKENKLYMLGDPFATFDDFDDLKNFVENEDNYFWIEAHANNANPKFVCENCDLKLKTHSQKRLEYAKKNHIDCS